MFYKIINLIKTNYILKNKNLKIKINKKDEKILKIFIKLNIIKIATKQTNNKYNIKFQYINNEPVFRKINNIYKSSSPVFINLKQILKINKKKNSIFFLSTNKGLISNFEAEKYKIGGLLLFKLNI